MVSKNNNNSDGSTSAANNPSNIQQNSSSGLNAVTSMFMSRPVREVRPPSPKSWQNFTPSPRSFN